MPDPVPVVGTAPPTTAPNVVYNIQNVTIQTLNVYNAPQAAASNNEVSSDEEGEAEERAAFLANVKRNAKRRRTSECGFLKKQLQKMSVAQRTKFAPEQGTLVGLCANCVLNWRSLRDAFMPDVEAENTMRRAHLLTKAIEDYETAYADDDEIAMQSALDVVLAKRTTLCRSCQVHSRKLSPKQLACKDEWERMKREACVKHGGCPKPGCTERGMASWVCMSADHVDPKTKVHHLGEYPWWSWNGGVEAMREEADKCQWMCRCCHFLEPTSSAGRKSRRTCPSKKRIREKQAHVDARKLEIGACQYHECGRIVTQETVRAFSFDHIDPKTKAMQETHPHLICKGEPGGVCGIAKNFCTSLADVRDELDAEMDKCTLLCENCHCSRKPRKRARWDAS